MRANQNTQQASKQNAKFFSVCCQNLETQIEVKHKVGFRTLVSNQKERDSEIKKKKMSLPSLNLNRSQNAAFQESKRSKDQNEWTKQG